jgi:excisionase family DNA binding protein
MNTVLNQRITISVDEAMSAIGIGRTMLYKLLTDGSIRSFRAGKKRLIVVASIHEWIAGQESHDQLGGS